MEFKKQLVTPSLAKKYLEANAKNRRVRGPVVLRYAQDMMNEKWKEDTGEVIKISKTGLVLDGQHRLMAVVKSNKPIWFHIAYNISDSVFDVLDTGSTRNAADVFFIDGAKNANIIPSIISTHHMLSNGLLATGRHKNERLTNAELLDTYLKNEDHWQYIARRTIVWYNSFAKILPPSYIGGLFAVFIDANRYDAEKFMDQLSTGTDIENNVVNLIRQKLIQDKMSIRKMPPTLKYALIIKSWNFFRKGESPKIIKFDTIRDNFPEAI